MGIDRAIQQYRKDAPFHQKRLPPTIPHQSSSIEPDRPTLPPPWLTTASPASKFRKLDSSTSVPVIKKQQTFSRDEKPTSRIPPQQKKVVTTTATSVAKRETHGRQPDIHTLITQTTRFQNGDVKRSLWYDPLALQQEDELADYQFALQVAKKLYKK
jgi:hypothetical protein